MLHSRFWQATVQAHLHVQQSLQQAESCLAHRALGIRTPLAGQPDVRLQILPDILLCDTFRVCDCTCELIQEQSWGHP